MRPLVFVGSSSEAAEHVAPAIQAELSRVATVQIWNQDFFPPGSYVIDTLAEKADTFDFAVLIFAADDVIESRGKHFLAARDNTVLEAGFFLAQLGRQRTFIVAPRGDDLRLPSDLAGLTGITYPKELSAELIRAELGPMCYTLRTHIEALGRRSWPADQLSEAMFVVLALFAERRHIDLVVASEVLARFNGAGKPSDSGAWGKAAYYMMLYLSRLDLVQPVTVMSVPAWQLTKRGNARAKSSEFRGTLVGILASDRGAGVSSFFSGQ